MDILRNADVEFFVYFSRQLPSWSDPGNNIFHIPLASANLHSFHESPRYPLGAHHFTAYSPSLDNRHLGRTQVSGQLLLTRGHYALIPPDLYISLFSFPPVPWLIQSDHALNGRSKEISCPPKDILIPPRRIPFSLL